VLGVDKYQEIKTEGSEKELTQKIAEMQTGDLQKG
jgi:hypothetical protein